MNTSLLDCQQYKKPKKNDRKNIEDIIQCSLNIIRDHSTSVSMLDSNLMPSQSAELSLTLNQMYVIASLLVTCEAPSCSRLLEAFGNSKEYQKH